MQVRPSDRPPDAVKFACPVCGTQLMGEVRNDAATLTLSPPACGFGHPRTEMEQVYIGADAYRKRADGCP